MRQTIRGGGVRRISTRSKFYSLAGSLQHDHGMLSIERLTHRGRGEIELTFRVTERGYQEFGGEDV